MTERWVTPEELSDALQIPLATLYTWRYKGSGPTAYKVGRHLRYRERDVEAWLAEQVKEPSTTGRAD